MNPNIEPAYDAELHDVAWFGERLIGTIKNDSKNRFRDGTVVNTSSVRGHLLNFKGDHTRKIARTKNTRYLIVNWAGKKNAMVKGQDK